MVQNNRRQVGMSETELEVGSTEDVEGIKLMDRHVLESVTHTQCRTAVPSSMPGTCCRRPLLPPFLFNVHIHIILHQTNKEKNFD